MVKKQTAKSNVNKYPIDSICIQKKLTQKYLSIIP